MKVFQSFLVFSSIICGIFAIGEHCGDKGCYEVIKTLTHLMEIKFNETSDLLDNIANDLNKQNFGGDRKFKIAIDGVDGKLKKLLDEIATGVDGGETSIIELINNVFDEVTQIENMAREIDNENENSEKNVKSIQSSKENIQEIIREIQEDINRLQNMTSYDGPEALHNAFDRSEKFNANFNELKDVLGEVKTILKDYEDGLENSKNFTSIAMKSFVQASKDADKAIETEKFVDDNLKQFGDLEKIGEEFENMKKVAKNAFNEANSVYNDAFELLNEVSAFEINDKLREFKLKIENLGNHSKTTHENLKEFSEENLKFIEEFEKVIDSVEILEGRAFELQDKIAQQLEVIENIHENALKAIAEKDEIVYTARNIYNSLEDFVLKVESSREIARSAMEKIPAIVKKMQDSVNIVEKLENDLNDQTKAAENAKTKCSTAKKQMDKILSESDEIKEKIAQLEIDFEPLPDEASNSAKETMRLSDAIDNLEKIEAGDDKLIESTQIKIEKTKSKAKDVDEKVDDALNKFKGLMEEMGKVKNIDNEILSKFEARLIEAEEELEKSGINHNLNILRAQRHEQTELIDRYKLEIAELEFQVAIIKENAESLEKKCFKRTRLEP